MKLTSLLGWSLLALPTTIASSSSSSSADKEAIVYLLNFPVDKEVNLSKKESSIFLNSFLHADQSLTKLGDNDDLIDLLNRFYSSDLSNQGEKLIISIKGDNLEDLGTPAFRTKHLSSKRISKLAKNLYGEKIKLTPELTLATNYNEDNQNPIVEYFKYFDHKLDSIWKNYTQHHQQGIEGYSPTNDEIFINELSQLVHLENRNAKDMNKEITYDGINEKLQEQVVLSKRIFEVFFVDLSSLLSIKRKIGSNAQTYIHSKQVLTNLIKKLSEKYDVLVICHPNSQDLPHLNKRSIELASKSFQYGTEDACEIATNNCNSHGKCKQQNGKYWSCLCQPSFNKTTSKTTTWVGYDCAKKDVSVEANLFLWTSIALVVLLVGGIKLMFSIGNQPLPGVLDAATVPKKGSL